MCWELVFTALNFPIKSLKIIPSNFLCKLITFLILTIQVNWSKYLTTLGDTDFDTDEGLTHTQSTLPSYKNHSTDLDDTSIDSFLYNGNVGLTWVN